MFKCKKEFIYVSRSTGVNQDNCKYIALNVLSKEDKTKQSFITKDFELISKLDNMKFNDFQNVLLTVEFKKVFNRNTRYSSWQCELIDVGTTA